MILSAQESVFSIPFRFLWSTNFAGELEATEPHTSSLRSSGLARFVGDETNQRLRVFFRDQPQGVDLNELSQVWPLVLFGSVGTGKTSLALTLLAEIAEQNPESFVPQPSHRSSRGQRKSSPKKGVLVLTGADFDRRFRASLGTDSGAEFRRRVVSSRGLFIDGADQLAHKPAAQLELVHILDEMDAAHRPVILTMERQPWQYENFHSQLISRLTGGLTIPVCEPGPAARSVIIRDFCDLHRLNLSDDSIAMLANRLAISVPKIAHFFGQLKTAVQLDQKLARNDDPNQPIEPAFIDRLFHRSADDQERVTKFILQSVATEFKVRLKELTGNSRKQSLVFARSVAVYLLRKLVGISFLKIGAVLGHRDHSTIMHAYRKIENLMDGDRLMAPKAANANPDRIKILDLEHRLTNYLSSDIKFEEAR